MNADGSSQGASHPWLKSYPTFAPWDMPLPAAPVFNILHDAAAKFANRPAMDFFGKHWTYAETAALAAQAAKGFQKLGVTKGTRVGLLLPNTPYYIAAYFGVLMAGGIVVNMNPLYAVRELEVMVKDSGAEILVTMDLTAMYPKARTLLNNTNIRKLVVCSMTEALPLGTAVLFNLFRRSTVANVEEDDRQVWWEELVDNDGTHERVPIDPKEDVAVLQYTGGTTGLPKGAMLTHANITANARMVSRWHGSPVYGHEKFLAALPFFHVFAMTVALLCAMDLGAEIIMMPRFELKDALKKIDKKKPTVFPAVPTIFTAINTSPLSKNYDLTSLKLCISGGAPLPVEVKHEFEESSGCVVVEGYGLSETSPVVCTNPTHGINKAGSVGLPMPNTIIEIRALDDDRVLGIGEKGEICVRGPQVMKGYWNRPDDTAAVMKNGAFHTGDVGYIDEDGYVFIVDRIKDMINASGYKIYPRMVEEAIHLHPAVEEVTVIGVADPYRGQAPKAFIKVRDGMTLSETEIREFLKEKLSKIEQPAQYEFRDVLPKTLIGKLSKKELKQEEAAKSGD
ncbi:MAG: long-chain fatty acid--CoA ligase [Proteobacteria bacterium]|nr:long-chain fatty acid--CoA ligase [Pseudomonadota bacterium]